MNDESIPDRWELPLEVLDQIDRVCDGFEAAWVRGGRPQAEDWLEEVAPHYRKALLRDLLAAEIAARRRRGESPSPGEYRDRLPDDAAAVNSALGLKAVAPVAEPHDGLLLGLLAFQTGLVNRSTLVEALGAWMRDRAQPLSEVLATMGAVDAHRRAWLEGLVAEHLRFHGGDVRKCLAALPAGASTREWLIRLADPELNDTMSYVGTDPQPTESASDDLDHTVTSTVATTADPIRFRVLRPHARGGLGAVFVALDAELNREVALKEMLNCYADDPVSRSRFLVEAEITGGLEHPGIVPIYGLGTYGDGRPYYAMRFIKGENLKEAIERFHANVALKTDAGSHSLELRKLLRRFVDVCNAVEYAHSRGILHRDIKPGNVIVGKYGETLVIDWGLAKPMGQSGPSAAGGELPLKISSAGRTSVTAPGSALGTPSFMSPEQAAGDLDRLGALSDVYSLGATLYCLLTGRPPVAGNDVRAVLDAVKCGAFSPPRTVDPSIDRALEAVCLKAMALEPENRYASPRELADDLERWSADEPVTAWLEPFFVRAGRWARRHRTAVAAAGLSLATAVMLLSILNILVTKAQRETAQALNRVREEQQRTVAALERADTNFHRARQAVEDYFTTVSEDKLLDEPGMQSLREKLLRSALKYHEAFLLERAGDASVEAELAHSHQRYGVIAITTGGREEGGTHLRTALDTFRKLSREHPDRLEYRRQIAQILFDLGIYYQNAIQAAEAVGSYRESIALFEELIRVMPDDEVIQESFARCLSAFGFYLSHHRGRGEDGPQLLARSREIIERLTTKHPDSLKLWYRLAYVQLDLYGSYFGDEARQDEAVQALHDTLEKLQKLAGHNTISPRLLHLVARIHSQQGVLALGKRQTQAAITEFRQARTILLDIVQRNPDVESYQKLLASNSMRLGHSLIELGAFEESLGPLFESRDVFERHSAANPENFAFQTRFHATLGAIGRAQRGLGRYDEAVLTFKKAVTLAADVSKRDPSNIFKRGDIMTLNLSLALSLTHGGHHKEAVIAYRESQALSKEMFGGEGWSHLGDETMGYILLAYSLREIGQIEEAERGIARIRRMNGLAPAQLSEIAAYDARGAELLAKAGGSAQAVEAIRHEAIALLHRAVLIGPPEPLALRLFGEKFQFRDRPDFQGLLLDAAFPADPFTPGASPDRRY